MKIFYSVLSGIILSTIVFTLLFGFQSNNKVDDKPNNQQIASQPDIPEEMYLFGEKVPLENFEIYERVDRELVVNAYWHSATILALKRAARWFPVIEPILKRNNIPVDFKYLAVAESNLENVVSPAGATGFWQFIKSAAVEYGLEVNDEVDERYDVEKSTEAACRYLKDAYAKYGSWTMAAAAYNAGMNGISKWSSIQKTNNYYNLTLGIETSRYIARIAAIKIIMENPVKYGYYLNNDDLYNPLKYKEVILDSSVADFADYAASLGINYKTLKLFNPWLRDSSLKNKNGKKYTIKIPEEGSIVLIKE
ncbi:transglycosylase SLT domain-containing protein [Ignavibacterium sp.]|uniref:lytic transglycosylase domain-containing protein n=1 Tax=Ignavibacterium sp. TaxID=2651167 RepID=UPI00307ECEA9